MDWITGIQRALDYIEAHLTDDIDYEAAAREAASSSFHFQRMFSMLVGYTLGDYIRMRLCRLPPMSFTIQIKRSSILRCNTDTIRQKAFLALSHAFMASRQPKHAEAVISSPFPVFPLS